MKQFLYSVICLYILILFNACRTNNYSEDPKVKTETCVRFWYKLGKPDEKSGDSTITTYNEFANPIEEKSSSNKRLYVYERDTLLVSETQYGLNDNSIWYKKNITYNEKGLKESLKIYTSFTTSKVPELVAGMRFFYDANGKVSEKKYFGGIQYNEEEYPQTVSSNDQDIAARENRRKADSSSAKYIRNKDGKVNRIYFNNDTSDCIIYTYNKSNQLISKERKQKIFSLNSSNLSLLLKGTKIDLDSTSKEKTFTGTRYFYNGDKLAKLEEVSYNKITQVKIFNNKEHATEIKWFSDDDELYWKKTLNYYENGKLKEVIKYNDINEPEFADKFEYEYY